MSLMVEQIDRKPHEDRSIFDIARLTDRLERAKLKTWGEVFSTPEQNLMSRRLIGRKTVDSILEFKNIVEINAEATKRKRSHNVEIQVNTSRYYFKRVFLIDGTPVSFISRSISTFMDTLFRGGAVVQTEEMKDETGFLTNYFGIEFSEYANGTIALASRGSVRLKSAA